MSTEAAPKGVNHFQQQCWGGCKKKQGCGCAYCGAAGICCRKGWHDHKNGCNGKIGGNGKHVCVKAPKGVCKKATAKPGSAVWGVNKADIIWYRAGVKGKAVAKAKGKAVAK